MSATKRPGFTLIELLVAVTIFSGLVILSLATFARSIASSTIVSKERERTEATRSVFDQIANDTNYLAQETGYLIKDQGCGIQVTTYELKNGYLICERGEKIQFLLRYPGSSSFVFREYRLETTNRKTILMREQRNCPLSSSPCDITRTSTGSTDLLSKKFSVVPETGANKLFSEIKETSTSRYAIGIRLTVVPVNNLAEINNTSKCQGQSACYTLATTIVPGGKR